jgi:hypothetical protein
MAQSVERLGFGLDDRGLIPAAARDFSLLHRVQTGSRAHLASYTMGTGVLSPGIKRQVRDINHSPPSSAEVKNCGSITPLSHTLSWHST